MSDTASRRHALANVRVVDFSWVRAGPWATRWLGAFGAEVIKIEWPENERGRLPSTTTPQHLETNLNTSGNFNDTNVNKKSLSLNVRSAKGLEVVKQLIAISDIVIENFSSRVLRNWGLGYDELCKIKPDIGLFFGFPFQISICILRNTKIGNKRSSKINSSGTIY